MNDSRIQLFGQSMERGSDELFQYVCCICDKVRRYREAKYYCGHCDILYCDDCLNNERERHQCHKVVAVSDWGEDRSDRCLSCHRDGSKVSRHCMDHDVRCCYQCVKDKHGGCQTIFEIAEFARGVYANKEFQSVSEEVERKATDVEQITSKKKKDRRALQDSKQGSMGRLKLLRKKVNDIFDKLEKAATNEIDTSYGDDERRLDSDINEYENILASLRCLKRYIESKTATESQMFLKLEQIRDRLVDFDMQLIERESSEPNFKEYEFTEDPTVLSFIESIDTLKLKRHVNEPEQRLPEIQALPVQGRMTDDTAGRSRDLQNITSRAQLMMLESSARTKNEGSSGDTASGLPKAKLQNTAPLMLPKISARTNNEGSSGDTASGLKRSTTPIATGKDDQSQIRDVHVHAETTSQPKRRSEESHTPLLTSTKATPQHMNQKTPTGNQVKTTLKIETQPGMKTSMDVKFDTHVSFNQNESPNNVKKELREEQVSAASPPAPTASSRCVGRSEYDVPKQECVTPKTPRQSTSTPTFSKSSLIRPDKISDISDLHDTRSSREEILPQRFNIRLQGDIDICNIHGMFGLPSGNILLSDSKNKNLKLMDQSYKIIAACQLTARPREVCEAGDNQAVVAMNNKRLQFVTITNDTTLKPSRCISLDHDCYGISHCNGNSFSAIGRYLHQLDKIGKQFGSQIRPHTLWGLI